MVCVCVCRQLTRVDLIHSGSTIPQRPMSGDLGPLESLPELHTLHLEGLHLQRLQVW